MNPGRQILVLSTVDTIAMVTGMSDGRWIFLEEPRAGRSRGWEEKESRQRERMKRNVPIATQRDRSKLACLRARRGYMCTAAIRAHVAA